MNHECTDSQLLVTVSYHSFLNHNKKPLSCLLGSLKPTQPEPTTVVHARDDCVDQRQHSLRCPQASQDRAEHSASTELHEIVKRSLSPFESSLRAKVRNEQLDGTKIAPKKLCQMAGLASWWMIGLEWLAKIAQIDFPIDTRHRNRTQRCAAVADPQVVSGDS